MADPLDNLKDAAHTAVGLAVLGFQRAQVRRREFGRQFDAVVADVRQRMSSSGGPHSSE